MTAITPACAHAYQLICMTKHILAVPSQKFRLPAAKARYPHLPSARTTTRDTGNEFQGWAIYTDGGTRLADGETLARWSAFTRCHQGKIFVMFGPVVTSRVRRSQNPSNTTAELSSMIEALSFLGPSGTLARDAR